MFTLRLSSILFSGAVAASLFVSSAASAQGGPWFDVGPALGGASGDPQLTPSGTITAGGQTTLTVSNAAPNAPLFVVAGPNPINLPLFGGVLVPNPVVVLPFGTTDSRGTSSLTFNWPAFPAGTPYYFQDWIVDPSGPQGFTASNAVAGLTLDAAEGGVYDHINAARANWAFPIDSVAVLGLGIVDPSTEQTYVDLVLDAFYPSLDANDPTTLGIGMLSSDPTIDPQVIADYRSDLDDIIDPGVEIVMVTWDSPQAGVFQTYAVADPATGEALYETFTHVIPAQWPMLIPPPLLGASAGLPGGANPTTKTGKWGPWKPTNGFGVTVFSMTCYAIATCEGEELVDCDCSADAIGKAFGWEAKGTCESKVIGNCCKATCHFGYASGFKSVKIGADGITIEITGNLGTSGEFSRTALVCCGE